MRNLNFKNKNLLAAFLIFAFLTYNMQVRCERNLNLNSNSKITNFFADVKNFLSTLFTSSNEQHQNTTITPNSQINPDGTPNLQNLIKMTTKYKYKQLNFKNLVEEGTFPFTFPAMTSIDVASLKNYKTPNDIVCVIDVSGSMLSSGKIGLVKESLENLLDYLDERDRLSLIVFNNKAEVLFELNLMTEKNKDLARVVIRGIRADGGTSIKEGLILAYETLSKRQRKNEMTSIILLSDGLDNYNDQVNPNLAGIVDEEKYDPEIVINTFGYGQHHDSKLMSDIAIIGRGKFYYVDDVNKIDETFMHCVGGLFSVVAKDAVLKLTLKHVGAGKIKKVYVLKENVISSEESDGSFLIKIPNLIYGKKLNFIYLIEITDPKIFPVTLDDDCFSNLSLIQAELIIIKGTDKCLINSQTEIPIENIPCLTHSQLIHAQENINNDVTANYLRVKSTEVIEESIKHSEMNKFDEVQVLLDDFKAEIKKEESHNDDIFLKHLENDIERLKKSTKNISSYSMDGVHFAKSMKLDNIQETALVLSNVNQQEMMDEAKVRKSRKRGQDL